MWDIAFQGLVFGAASLIAYVLRRQSLVEWKAAAELCGLESVEVHAWTLKVKARAGPVAVRIEPSRDDKRPTRIVVAAPGPPGFQDVTIQGAPLFLQPVQIGDPSFEGRFVVEGPARLVAALLDEETRRLLTRLGFASLRLSAGELQSLMTDEQIFDILPGLVEVGRRFARPLDIPLRLAENASRDTEPGVRLQNLLLLIREHPKDRSTAEAIRRAFSDPSPAVRLHAAKEMGAEGHGALLEIAESLEDDTLSAEAVSALGRGLPIERAKALLDCAWSAGRLRSVHACLRALGLRGAAAVDKLAEVLAQPADIELAIAAARALSETGSPAAEPPLVLALQSREAAELREAAAKALGRVGSVAAVLPLKEAADRSLLDLDLRRAARQSVAEIQSRAQGASPGQLSLAGAETGQLSLAQTEAGQLSLAEDPAGQLSLGDDS
ncbi:MAG TPA: HEAT repeat domain-containing protein [Thermoanaerobaculia bacterium]|jgi:HEAT repeat protein|nr:HEAT repeat domain-containing protein [Thermoanaerobaculia bacterium]